MDLSFSPLSAPSNGTDTALLTPPAPAPVATPVATASASESSDFLAAVTAALANPPAAMAAVEPAVAVGPLDILPESGNATANKTKIIIKALRGMEESIRNIINLLEEQGPSSAAAALAAGADSSMRDLAYAAAQAMDGRVVEGVFDGRQMVGSDGQPYTVPPNYASKSKLVEGDMLKLTITPRGSFIYKQIGPIERSNVMASLGFDQTNNEWYAAEGDKRWSVLKASVTFFRGEQGDDVALLVPKNAPSKWAAVENIIKKNPLV